MNHLLRGHAPITDAGWKLIDDEAATRVRPSLAARRVVDFSGPHGWEHSATNVGRTTALASSPVDGVSALQRRVLALVELRADFALARTELSDHDRGALDPDLGDLDRAAYQIAVAENVAVVHGWEEASFGGLAEVSRAFGRCQLERLAQLAREHRDVVQRAQQLLQILEPGDEVAGAVDLAAQRFEKIAQPLGSDARLVCALFVGNRLHAGQLAQKLGGVRRRAAAPADRRHMSG